MAARPSAGQSDSNIVRECQRVEVNAGQVGKRVCSLEFGRAAAVSRSESINEMARPCSAA